MQETMYSQTTLGAIAILTTQKVVLPANGSVSGTVKYTETDATIVSVGYQNMGWQNGIWSTQCFVQYPQQGVIQVQTNNSSNVDMYFYATLLCLDGPPKGQLVFTPA